MMHIGELIVHRTLFDMKSIRYNHIFDLKDHFVLNILYNYTLFIMTLASNFDIINNKKQTKGFKCSLLHSIRQYLVSKLFCNTFFLSSLTFKLNFN